MKPVKNNEDLLDKISVNATSVDASQTDKILESLSGI